MPANTVLVPSADGRIGQAAVQATPPQAMRHALIDLGLAGQQAQHTTPAEVAAH